MYFVKQQIIEQCERMRDKLCYIAECELMDRIMDCRDHEESKKIIQQQEDIYSKIEELDNARNNLICEGYIFKGYWKDIEILKKYATQRNILDLVINIKLVSEL